MCREIRFKGKRVDNGEWVYGPSIWQLFNGLEIWIGKSTGDWKVDPKTVGQFTGLKDKNGKDIYEGDRVKIQDEVVTIFFNESMASWDYEYGGGDCEPIIPDGSYYEPSGLEVIGNIHENPDLL